MATLNSGKFVGSTSIEETNKIDALFVLFSSVLVFIMTIGVGLVYSGAADRRSSIVLVRLPLIVAAFSSCLWFLFGYSLTFSNTVDPLPEKPSSTYYGRNASYEMFREGLSTPLNTPSVHLPVMSHALFQGMFASFTAALVCGATNRYIPISRFLVFIFFWSIVVYYPIARSTWHPEGWTRNTFQVLDFAGGSPVHINAGFTAAAIAIFRKIETAGLSGWWQDLRDELMKTLQRAIGLMKICLGRGKPLKPKLPLRSDQESRPGSRGNQAPPTDANNTGIQMGRIIQDGQDEDTNTHVNQQAQRHKHSLSLSDPNGRDGVRDAVEQSPLPQSPEAESTVRTIETRLQNLEANSSRLLGLLPDKDEPPSNITSTVLGTALLWFGWFGFNGGSALALNDRAMSACLSTHLAGCFGGMAQIIIQWLMNGFIRRLYSQGGSKKVSILSFCDGSIAGLVAITPAAGYVPVRLSPMFGVLGAAFAEMGKLFGGKFLQDKPLFVWAIHAGAGFIGMALTGPFARDSVVRLGDDAAESVEDRPKGYQVLVSIIDAFIAFVGSMAILFLMKVILSGLQSVNEIRHKSRPTWVWVSVLYSAGSEKAWTLEGLPQHKWLRKGVTAGEVKNE